MHFESDCRFGMDPIFSQYSLALSCPSTTTSSSSASSTYCPFTPTSRRSTSHEFGNMDFDGHCNSVSHRAELTPPSSAMGKSMLGPVKPGPEHISFSYSLPNTPMKQEQLSFEYEHMMEINMANHGPMGSLTPSNSFGMSSYSADAAMVPASFMMTPTQSISGSEAADTGLPWSCANNSPLSFFPERQLSRDFDTFDMDCDSQSPLGYHLHDRNSPNRMYAQRKLMMYEIQQRSAGLQRAQIQSSRKGSIKHNSAQVDVVGRAMCKCDYPGCHKAFRRNEHLKRHKQTFHGEGPNRFSCEFYGKDQFNRQDNLNNHRKLHARPNSRNRGVEFIPAAVPVIEQEERSRKRRAPSKSKIAEKRGSED
ncbi:C2H2 type master regulator of conidiophore development brlA [Fusarium oxysporum f. sp. narcissi]|uniref:C2H2 type master regulator of conidiophore development brlA n=1 Tax=Fusarium oxysporum f. sp. narcissi TaxID=451672 RepID=A0A4V1RXV4_FUSOX|nr:C2H2 type master regulator of conidiophore development brlA [Fusarium oxysporum f. sp. narcissi]